MNKSIDMYSFNFLLLIYKVLVRTMLTHIKNIEGCFSPDRSKQCFGIRC